MKMVHENKSHLYCWHFIFILTISYHSAFAQKAKYTGFIMKSHHIAFIDNNSNACYRILFSGDSIVNLSADELHNYFYIDSAQYSITKTNFLKSLIDTAANEKRLKRQTKSINAVLNVVVDSTVKQQLQEEEEALLQRMDTSSVYFKNEFGSDFLIWYFELPFLYRPRYNSDFKTTRKATHQLCLSFIAGTNVITLTTYVYEGEVLEDKIQFLKKQIADNIHFYPGYVNTYALEQQLNDTVDQPAYHDSVSNIYIPFPRWLDFYSVGNTIVGEFNDSLDTRNSIMCLVIGKNDTRYQYFSIFQNYFLSKDEVKKQIEITSPVPGFIMYNITEKQGKHSVKAVYAFAETNKEFCYFRFSSNDNVYEQKLLQFYDYLKQTGMDKAISDKDRD